MRSDPSGQHAEGIQHIATNTAPPGTEDTHRGTEGGLGTGRESTVGTGLESGGLGTTHPTEGGAGTGMESSRMEPGAESGGVSSMSSSGANTISPLKPSGESMTQPTQSEGGMMGTVKSYLGYGSATGTGATETDRAAPPQVGGDDRVVEGSGSGAGMSGAAASAASAVGLGSGNSAAGGGMGSTSASSGAVDENARSASTAEAGKENVQETANTEGAKTSGGEGEGEGEKSKPSGGSKGKLENKDAIPTAGGERLGEKHWGESKIVPDDPTKGKKGSEAGVSSEEGQPTRKFTYPDSGEYVLQVVGILSGDLQSKPPTTRRRIWAARRDHLARRRRTANPVVAIPAARRRPA